MNRSERTSLPRSLLVGSQVAPTKRWIRFAARVALCFLSLCLPINALAQSDFESHLAVAVSAQSAGNIPAAIAAYQSALTIRRNVPEVWANLGLMQHQTGDYTGALKSFRVANQLQPKLFVPLLFLGIENLQIGDRTAAIHYLSMARQLRPNDFEVHMNLGRAYFGLKQFDSASSAYRRATELDPHNGEAWYRLGITYLEISEAKSHDLARLNRQSPFFQRLDAESLSDQEKLSEAAERFRKLLSAQSFPPCSRSSFGLVLVRQGESSRAQTEFQQDLKSGGCSLAEIGLIRVALEKGETANAFSSIASLWKLDSGFVKAYASELTRAMTPEQITAFDDALAQPAIPDISPEVVSVLRLALRGGRTQSTKDDGSEDSTSGKTAALLTSQDYYARGQYAKCVRSLRSTMAPLSRDKLSLLATCSFYNGDYGTTVAAARKLQLSSLAQEEGFYWSILAEQRQALLALAYAGEVEPNSIRLHELLAESYRDRERYVDAEAEYKVALNINPKEFSALVGAATNYLQEFRIDLAHEMIQNALAQNPSDAEANYIMGEVLMAEHRYPDAEVYLRTGLGAKAELVPRIHALLGQVYATQGDTKRAIEEYQLGLPSDDDGSVHFQLGRLYQKVGDAKLAAEAFADSKTLNQKKQSAARNTYGHLQTAPSPHP